MLYGMAMLSVAACMEEELVNEVPLQAEFEADIEAPSSAISVFEGDPEEETRTYIVEGDEVGIKWRAKESIGVYGTFSKNAKFTSTNTKNAATVEFTGLLLGTPKYAYYPYSTANNGVSQTAVKGTMPAVRPYSSANKDLVADYRAGTLDSRNWLTAKFTLNRLVSIFRFLVDATGTPLEGDNIQSISMKVSNKHKLSGDFTINLQTQALNMGAFKEGNDSLTLEWTDSPTLLSGNVYSAYMTLLPNVKAGDVLTTTIRTNKHVATFSRAVKSDFAANKIYKYAMTLKDLDLTVTEVATKPEEPEVPAVTPVLNSLKFTVADNPGKILPRKFSVSTSAKVTTNSVDEEVCDINQENKKVTLYVPYLNSRKLVPTFEIPEGTRLLLDSGEEAFNGKEADFTNVKQIGVINSANEVAIYDVEFTNTGLPVVVVNQRSSVNHTENNSEYSKASSTWYSATGTEWLAKDSDWFMEDGDNFMVYNPDGTSALTDKNGNVVEEPILSSTRLRGNVSQRMPKKPFAVKLDSKSGILDMPAHKRWVLLANWKDRTLMRNEVAFGLAKVFEETFPNDGMEWNPSGQHVELVYNGVHVGNYYLCEQIKIDGNRLDINDPYEDSKSTKPEDWGYLFELDDAFDETENGQFMSKHYIPFLSKDANSTEGLDYAKKIIYGVEDNLYNQKYDAAFGTYDLTSAIDYWLIQELMMNSETQHPKSVYMYINDGKLFTGPLWDFDWNTLPTASSYSENGYSYTKSILADAVHYRKSGSGYPSGPYESSSWFSTTTDKNYIWYPMLVKSTTFKEKAKERWEKVKPALIAYAETLPTIAEKISKSEEENNKMWPVDTKSGGERRSFYGIGHTADKNSGGYCGDEGMSFKDAVQKLSDNLIERINGMDNFVSSTSWPSISIKSSTK